MQIPAVGDNMTRDSCIMGHTTHCLMISSTNVTLFYVSPFKTGCIKCLSYTVEARSIILFYYVLKAVISKASGSNDMAAGPGGRAA
jgi:hypothetical protein